MSDGITITPGSGRTIHADVVTLNGTTGLAQTVKLIDATDASTNKLIISSAGAAKVDGSAVTQPVSGTVSAAKSGTWGMTVTGTVSAAKSGTWGMTVTGTVASTQGGAWNINRVTTITTVTNPVAVTKSGTWGLTVTGTVSAAKSGTWGMTVTGTVAVTQGGALNVNRVTTVTTVTNPVAVTKSGTWGLTVSGSVAATKSGTWGMTATQGGAWNVNRVTTVTTVTNPVAVTKSGTWGLTVTGTVAATKSGTWGLTVTGTVAATKSGTWGMTVTGTIAETNSANSLTALQLIDDVVYVDDTATHSTGTSKGILNMAVAVPTDTAVSANDIAAIGMTVDRKLWVAVMDVIPGPSYAASAAQTQTNLDGLADSATHVTGWESTAIDNSTNRYKDYRINAKLVTEGAAVTAGQCKMWLVAEMDDSTWPDVFDGTESAETITDTEQRDQILRLAVAVTHDTGTAETIWLMCPSVAAVFNGMVPRKFVIFITQNTGTTLETTGDPNQVYVAGVS